MTGFTLGISLAVSAGARPDYSYTGSPIPVPDSTGLGCAGVSPGTPAEASIHVTDSFMITAVRCSFHVTHDWQGDLVIKLVHPGGTSVTLIDRPGTASVPPQCGYLSDNFGLSAVQPFTASDWAFQGPYDTPYLPAAPAGGGPGINQISGDWKPFQALSAFNSLSTAGTWKFRVVDCAAGSAGTIQAVTLHIDGVAFCYADCTEDLQLTVQDFGCFQTRFAQGAIYTDCNADGALTVADFGCFQTRFVSGCP